MRTRAKRAARRGSVLVKAGVATLVAALAGAGLWIAAAQAGQAVSAGGSADLVAAEVRDFEVVTIATGELEARQQVEIRSDLDSRATIEEIIDEGTRVEKGELLVRLNSEQIEEQITEEESRVETARADLEAAENAYRIQLSDNESALRAARLELELAELALDQWRQGDDVKQKEELTAEVDSAKADYDRLKEKFEQSKKLFDQNFKSKNEYDQEKIQLDEAESRLRQAELARQIYLNFQRPRDEKQKVSDVEEALAKVERVQTQNKIELASKDASRKNARRQLELRQERLAKLNEQLAACEITAPGPGLVVYQSSTRNGRWNNPDPPQAGTEVSPKSVIMILPDTSEMVASVRVHESLAGRIEPGLPATVRIEALGDARLSGQVASIGVLAESGSWRDPNLREYTVRIALNAGEHAGKLKPSMRAEASITLAEVDQALTIPVQSVFSEGRLRYVYAPADGRFERVPVRVGRRSATHAEVLAGLQEGERVLVRSPRPGEVVSDGWDLARLEEVGFTLDDSGSPVPAKGPQGPRGDRGRRSASAGSPPASADAG